MHRALRVPLEQKGCLWATGKGLSAVFEPKMASFTQAIGFAAKEVAD